MQDAVRKHLSAVDMYATILAAAMHDHGHVGYSNAFYINANDELAIRYKEPRGIPSACVPTCIRRPCQHPPLHPPHPREPPSLPGTHAPSPLGTMTAPCSRATTSPRHGASHSTTPATRLLYPSPYPRNAFSLDAKQREEALFTPSVFPPIRYNDGAVLESYHLASSWRLTLDDSSDPFAGFTNEQYLDARQTIVQAILGTDMKMHFNHLTKFKTHLSSGNLDAPDRARVRELLTMCLHAADVSNPCKPWKLCVHWAARVMMEFFRQGDKEAEMGLTVSPFMDRAKTNIAQVRCALHSRMQLIPLTHRHPHPPPPVLHSTLLILTPRPHPHPRLFPVHSARSASSISSSGPSSKSGRAGLAKRSAARCSVTSRPTWPLGIRTGRRLSATC
jgi:hypothetical protein